MEKIKPVLKALLFGAIVLLFFICSSLIAKALKLSQNRTLVFQGGMMLLSTIIPIFYIGSKKYDRSDIGFNKISLESLKKLLFYIPLIIAIGLLFISFKKNTSVKSLIVQLFFYISVAIALEVYFRGVIQKEFRGKMHILPALIIIAVLYAACNMYYFNRITYSKYIMIFVGSSFAIAGILGIIIESKGSLIFTIIFNVLYLLIGVNFTGGGKKLFLGQALALSVLFIYGLYLLIIYMKKDKEPKIETEEKEETVEEEKQLEEPNMTLE